MDPSTDPATPAVDGETRLTVAQFLSLDACTPIRTQLWTMLDGIRPDLVPTRDWLWSDVDWTYPEDVLRRFQQRAAALQEKQVARLHDNDEDRDKLAAHLRIINAAILFTWAILKFCEMQNFYHGAPAALIERYCHGSDAELGLAPTATKHDPAQMLAQLRLTEDGTSLPTSPASASPVQERAPTAKTRGSGEAQDLGNCRIYGLRPIGGNCYSIRLEYAYGPYVGTGSKRRDAKKYRFWSLTFEGEQTNDPDAGPLMYHYVQKSPQGPYGIDPTPEIDAWINASLVRVEYHRPAPEPPPDVLLQRHMSLAEDPDPLPADFALFARPTKRGRVATNWYAFNSYHASDRAEKLRDIALELLQRYATRGPGGTRIEQEDAKAELLRIGKQLGSENITEETLAAKLGRSKKTAGRRLKRAGWGTIQLYVQAVRQAELENQS